MNNLSTCADRLNKSPKESVKSTSETAIRDTSKIEAFQLSMDKISAIEEANSAASSSRDSSVIQDQQLFTTLSDGLFDGLAPAGNLSGTEALQSTRTAESVVHQSGDCSMAACVSEFVREYQRRILLRRNDAWNFQLMESGHSILTIKLSSNNKDEWHVRIDYQHQSGAYKSSFTKELQHQLQQVNSGLVVQVEE